MMPAMHGKHSRIRDSYWYAKMLRGSAYGIIPLNIINAVQISWGGFRDEISWGGFRDELTNNISLSLCIL